MLRVEEAAQRIREMLRTIPEDHTVVVWDDGTLRAMPATEAEGPELAAPDGAAEVIARFRASEVGMVDPEIEDQLEKGLAGRHSRWD